MSLFAASGSNTQYKSSNCKSDEKATTLFTYHATDNKKNEFNSMMLSCQASHLDTPDETTLRDMKQIASASINKEYGNYVTESDISIDAHGIALGNQGTKMKASEISKRRMASNCGPTYNLNHVTAYNRFTCRYLGTGVDERGREVRNPYQVWKGTLPSCDSAVEIGDDLEHDIRQLVWDAAGGEEAKLDVNQFLCSIHSIPHQ
jgi:hypothetical protein